MTGEDAGSIYYGICVGSDEKLRTYVVPGLERLGVEPERILTTSGHRSIFPAYNALLHAARAQEKCAALVLLHDDFEICDPAFEEIVLRELMQDDVAILGTIGGRGPTGVRWSQAKERFGRQPHTFYGAGDHGGGFHDVDMVDGGLMVLSRWAVEELTFDEATYHGFHGYDADICLQARAGGRRVRVIDVDTMHHSGGGFGDIANHQRTDDAFRKKWGFPMGSPLRRLKRRYPGVLRYRPFVRLYRRLAGRADGPT